MLPFDGYLIRRLSLCRCCNYVITFVDTRAHLVGGSLSRDQTQQSTSKVTATNLTMKENASETFFWRLSSNLAFSTCNWSWETGPPQLAGSQSGQSACVPCELRRTAWANCTRQPCTLAPSGHLIWVIIQHRSRQHVPSVVTYLTADQSRIERTTRVL